MKHLLVTITLTALLAGCTSSKKYVKYIQGLYIGDSSMPAPDTMLSCTTNVAVTFGGIVQVKKIAGASSYKCELHPRVPLAIFRNELLQCLRAPELAPKLAGRRLEIRLTSLPHLFKYSEIVEAAPTLLGTRLEYSYKIFPIFTNLTFEYSLYEAGAMLKKGIITLESNDKVYSAPIKPTKEDTRNAATKVYLSRYERYLTALSRHSIEILASEL